MRKPILTLALFTCLPTIALTDPASECGGGSQVEIGDCVADTLERVDGVIDTYLGFAMDSAKELDEVTDRTEAVPALDAAQTAWAAYRDAHCAYVGTTFGGGSGTAIGINACRITLGRARAETLMRYVQ
ncbi:MAG: lysozyme inhibitor LprI family protein [Pseudomonadota bacterium]